MHYSKNYDTAEPVLLSDLLSDRSQELRNGKRTIILRMWDSFNRVLPFGGMPLEENIVTLVAFSGVGKSYCALNFYLYPFYHGRHTSPPRTVFFSMDMATRKLAERYTSMICGDDYSNSRNILKNQYNRVEAQFNTYKFDNSLRIINGIKSMKGIQHGLDQIGEEFSPQLVIVDHLQCIPGGTTPAGMDEIMQEFMHMRDHYQCMFLLISQVSRPEKLEDKRALAEVPPLASQAKGSNAIEAASDYVIAIAQNNKDPRLEKMKGRVNLVFRKGRDFSTFGDNEENRLIKLWYNGAGLLEEIDMHDLR